MEFFEAPVIIHILKAQQAFGAMAALDDGALPLDRAALAIAAGHSAAKGITITAPLDHRGCHPQVAQGAIGGLIYE